MKKTTGPDVCSPSLPKKTGDKIFYAGLKGAAIALTLAKAALKTSGPLIVITGDPHSANSLERELKVFLPKDFPLFQFPDWETLPYDNFSPHQDIISDRLLVLSQLPTLSKGLLVVPITTLLHRLSPIYYVGAHSLLLKVGNTFDWETARSHLVQCGYQNVSSVITHGEFAIRGNIIDIFPMGSDKPVRIDLFGDEIETLRLFDPETQRSDDKINELQCLPAREFPLTKEAISLFRSKWRTLFEGDPTHSNIYQDVSQGTPSSGIEYYLPLFFESTSTLFDYFPNNATLVKLNDLEQSSLQFWDEINNRYSQYRHDIERPILPPDLLFVKTDELFSSINRFSQIALQPVHFESPKANQFNFDCKDLPDIAIETRNENPLLKLQNFLKLTPGKILFCAETQGRREIVLDLLNRGTLTPKIFNHWQDFFDSHETMGITVASIDEGVWLPSKDWVFIAESQLYGHQVMQRRRRHKLAPTKDESIRDLAELTIGSPVVHVDHGVGRYLGLVLLTVDNHPAEYVMLEYADGDKLYVPVSNLECISQYSGAQVNNAPLHKLGTKQWENIKKKAAEKAYDVAAELLDIYARREAKVGHPYRVNESYFQFASAFPFEETPDQAKAISDVLEDMKSNKPMDRLVCGDVGFGKTEVALRASFVAVQEGRQVIVLVPTTLLAQQHFETFTDRFADWAIRVEVISRFRSKKEQDKILEDLQSGRIDILIGTHKLLQENVKTHNLGLMIIDEEHRFGVRQKEKLKAFRTQVDILTLTATPIPRTLHMAFSTLRDLSIIATPPAKRLSIKTFVREYNLAMITEAILRELMRGGQVYYLHNDVQSIDKVAQMLFEALPQARVGVAHGQMRERQLEQVMSDFYHQRFNVLVCTTIIETGIDIPTANTIIIDRADKLGLAQLHQLRGRVGRSHHQAYAYCLTPPLKKLTPQSVKRLEALESLEELGSGFTLATHDLEIRGAGELLGEEQSGNMQEIGFTLYRELLERAVKSLKAGHKGLSEEPLRFGAEIDLAIPALIPEDYLPDVHTRLMLYKRISSAKDFNSLKELQVEMIDRFGLLPLSTKNLFKITTLKLKAQPIGIKKVQASLDSGKIDFIDKPNIDPDKIIKMIRNQPRNFKLVGSSQIKFMFDMQTPEQRFEIVENLLNHLNPEMK